MQHDGRTRRNQGCGGHRCLEGPRRPLRTSSAACLAATPRCAPPSASAQNADAKSLAIKRVCFYCRWRPAMSRWPRRTRNGGSRCPCLRLRRLGFHGPLQHRGRGLRDRGADGPCSAHTGAPAGSSRLAPRRAQRAVMPPLQRGRWELHYRLAPRGRAVDFACRGMVNPHTDTSEQWLLWHGHAGPSFRANREVCDEARFLRQ